MCVAKVSTSKKKETGPPKEIWDALSDEEKKIMGFISLEELRELKITIFAEKKKGSKENEAEGNLPVEENLEITLHNAIAVAHKDKAAPRSKFYFTDDFEFFEIFTNDGCLAFLEYRRWKGKPVCPHKNCNATDICTFENDKHQFKCRKCKKQFNVKTGTIFEDGRIEIKRFFLALYLENSLTYGVSAPEVARKAGVSLNTATLLLQTIRKHAYNQRMFVIKGKKPVQTDFSFVGGAAYNAHKSDRDNFKDNKNKMPVLVFKEQRGVTLAYSTKQKQEDVIQKAHEHIPLGTTIFSDGGGEFFILKNDYNFKWINHSLGQFARTEGIGVDRIKISTNAAESFNSCMKITFMKFRNSIPKKSLQDFLNAVVFRHNTREMSEFDKFCLGIDNMLFDVIPEFHGVTSLNGDRTSTPINER